jgi:hydroxypyruvate isomerase
MYRLSVCAETVFCQLPFPQRVEEIARSGFMVEFWRRTGADIEAVEQAMEADPSLEISNVSGSFDGSLMHPDGVETYLEDVKMRLAVARRVRCRRLMLLAGELGPAGEAINAVAAHPATRWITAYKTLCRVAEMAEKQDVFFSLENLNTKVDHRGYALPHVEDTVRLVEQVGSPRIRILLDIYHAQVEQGNVIQAIRDYRDFIGYVHVADVPGRHEPGTGEINYPEVARALREIGYAGVVGLEAYPLGGDHQALSRFRENFTPERVSATQ